MYIKHMRKQLFTFPLISEPLIEHKAPCPRKKRERSSAKKTEKRRERETRGERARERCVM